MKRIFKIMIFICSVTTLLVISTYHCLGQGYPVDIENQKITSTILHLDSLFWKTYNECNTVNSGQFLTDDVKFYHDKGGITDGKSALVASIQNHICGNRNQRIRREAVDGTVKVYPLRNGDSIYGAVISGEHYFYVTENKKPEKGRG